MDPIEVLYKYLADKGLNENQSRLILAGLAAAGISKDKAKDALTNLDKTGVPWPKLAERLSAEDMQDATKLTSLWRPFASGLAANWADEIAGVFGGESAKENYRVREALTTAERPRQSTAAEIAGGMAPAVAGGAGLVSGAAKVAAPVAARLASGAALGAGMGALSGAGAAQEGQRGEGAVEGGVMGGVVGGGMAGAGELAMPAGRELLRRFVPSRAVQSEVSAIAANPAVRQEFADQAGAGLAPAFAELTDDAAPLLKRAAGTRKEAVNAAEKAAQRDAILQREVQQAQDWYQQFAQVPMPIGRHPEMRRIVAKALGEEPTNVPDTVPADIVMNAYQMMRKAVRTAPGKEKYEQATGTKVANAFQTITRQEVEALELFMKAYKIPVDDLNKVYAVINEAGRRATANRKVVNAEQAAGAARRLGLHTGQDMNPTRGVIPRVIDALRPDASIARNMQRILDPNETSGLLNAGMEPLGMSPGMEGAALGGLIGMGLNYAD